MEGGTRSYSWGRSHLENTLQKHFTTVIPSSPTNSLRTRSIAESATEGQLLVPHLNSASKLSFKQIYIKEGSLSSKSCPLSFSPLASPSPAFPMVTPPGPASWDFVSEARGYFSPSGQAKGFLKLSVAVWRSWIFLNTSVCYIPLSLHPLSRCPPSCTCFLHSWKWLALLKQETCPFRNM